MSNLEEQVRKLIKYGNKKFNLNETNLRDIIDNVSVGNGSGGDFKIYGVNQIILPEGDCELELRSDGTGERFAVGQIIEGELCSLYLINE